MTWKIGHQVFLAITHGRNSLGLFENVRWSIVVSSVDRVPNGARSLDSGLSPAHAALSLWDRAALRIPSSYSAPPSLRLRPLNKMAKYT